MAGRGRKSYTKDEKLELVNKQIDECTIKLQSLKEQKKELEEQIKNEKLSELYEVIQASGKTIDELKMMFV